MSMKYFLIMLMICTLWGLHFVVVKTTIDNVAPPLFYAALRMSGVALVLLPKLKWHKGQMRKILIAGLGFGGLNYAFLFPGAGLTTAGGASIAIELYVPFSIILAVIFLGERIGLPRIAGIALAFAGVALISLSKQPEAVGPHFVLGMMLVALAGLCEAVAAMFVKTVKDVSPWQLLAWFACVGSMVLWPLTFILEDGQMRSFAPESRQAFVLALLYSIVCGSLIAHSAYYYMLSRLPMYKVAGVGLLSPLIAVIGGIIILGEPISTSLIIGGAMTLIGVLLILLRGKTPIPPVEV